MINETGVVHTGVTITPTADPLIYTVELTGVTGDGTITLAASTTSDIQDLAGNPLDSSVSSVDVYVDQTPPAAGPITAVTSSPTSDSSSTRYPIRRRGTSARTRRR